MRRCWTSSLVLVPFVLALLLICGCASSVSTRSGNSQDSVEMPKGVDFGSHVTVYPGALDAMNRYISNVIVLVGPEDKPQGCSGVLMAADKVLTAAHCVCAMKQITDSDKAKIEARLDAAYLLGDMSKGRKQTEREKAAWKRSLVSKAQTVADSLNCQGQVRVVIISYLAKTASFVPSPYDGVAVIPHPRFFNIEGDEHDGLFREADLAIIQLSKAVTEPFRAVQWPTKEVYQGQHITMVGYGLGETQYPKTPFGFRHFGESEIAGIDRFASGSTRFATAAQEPGGREFSRNYEGDSGGGGFSQEDDTVLVGIISARSDRQGAVFESVYPHVKWLSIYHN